MVREWGCATKSRRGYRLQDKRFRAKWEKILGIYPVSPPVGGGSRSMKQLKRAKVAMVLVCTLFLAAGHAVNAAVPEKEKPAKIDRQVSDSSGNPFARAIVSGPNSTTGQSTDFTADSQGRCRSGHLP